MRFGLELYWLVWVSMVGSGGDWVVWFFSNGFAGFLVGIC